MFDYDYSTQKATDPIGQNFCFILSHGRQAVISLAEHDLLKIFLAMSKELDNAISD